MPHQQNDRVHNFFCTFWIADTSYTPGLWSAANPALGQCVPTSLLIQDWLGGDLVSARITQKNGISESHYWNSVNGKNIDGTLRQYGDKIIRITPKNIPDGFSSFRDYVIKSPDTRSRYEILKNRITSKDIEDFFVLLNPTP